MRHFLCGSLPLGRPYSKRVPGISRQGRLNKLNRLWLVTRSGGVPVFVRGATRSPHDRRLPVCLVRDGENPTDHETVVSIRRTIGWDFRGEADGPPV